MRATSIIFRRELGAYLRSPLGWVIASVLLLVDGILFQSQALGGEILVSSVVHDLVSGTGIEFRESRDVELKGLEGPHRLFAVDLT